METPSRIVIAADVLRPLSASPGESATRANTRWLHALLDWPLARACGLPVHAVEWGNGFDTECFYRSMGMAPGLDAWARLHYATTLSQQAEAMVAEAFADAIVIGVELAPCIVASLTRAGVPVIDTIGTPLRFLDDVLNAWRTNRADVHARLVGHRFDDAVAWRQAGLIRAKAAWLPRLDVPQGAALLVGQVGSDKALIHHGEGRLLGFDDYVEALFALAERHRTVFYKAHPYEDGSGRSAAVIERFRSFRRVCDNVYRLMSEPGLEAVYAISSGCVSEARYFRKPGEHFYRPTHEVDDDGRDAYGFFDAVPVDQAWLEPAFWRDLLAPLVEVLPGLEPVPANRPHRIRRSLNADWGFLAIDQVVAVG
jgi:hypothetical protein